MRIGKILLIVFGGFGVMVALGLLAGGALLLWIDSDWKDEDGFITTPAERFQSETHAMVSQDLDIATDAPDWLFGSDNFADIKIEAAAGGPDALFVGIGAEDDVAGYLAGVEQDVVHDIDYEPFRVDYQRRAGALMPGPPAEQDFWVASADGTGTQVLEWDLAQGTWTVVVMNQDGSPGIAADLRLGAKVPFVFALGLGLLLAGVAGMALALVVVYLGIRSEPGTRPAPAPPAGVEHDLEKSAF